MKGIEIRNGEMIITNKYGEHIISCPSCKEQGKNVDGQWMCVNEDCRVRRFFTG